jgi:phage terminase small subunit
MSEQPAGEKVVKLTRKQQRFIEEYCIDMNATRAAKAAGYNPNTAYIIGHENLNKPNIKALIDKRFAEYSMSADEAMRRLTDWGRGSLEPFLTENGEVIISSKQAKKNIRLLKKVKHTTRTTVTKAGNEYIEKTIEIELVDPKDAVIQLAKIRGLYKDSGGGGETNVTINWNGKPLPAPESDDEPE